VQAAICEPDQRKNLVACSKKKIDLNAFTEISHPCYKQWRTPVVLSDVFEC